MNKDYVYIERDSSNKFHQKKTAFQVAKQTKFDENSRKKNVALILLIFFLVFCVIASLVTVIKLKESCTQNKTNNNLSTICGKMSPKIESINNATLASNYKWPWLAAIFIKKKYMCTGVLIHNRFVLTNDCVFNTSIDNLDVLIETNDLSKIEITQYYKVDKIIMNEKYEKTEGTSHLNNIALIKLSKPVKESANVSTICLPDSTITSSFLLNKLAIVAGWGIVASKNSTHKQYDPSEVTVKFRDGPLIRKFDNKKIISNHYCVLNANNELCLENNSPLMLKINQHWSVVGLASFSRVENNTCTIPSFYFFTKVPLFLNWIYQNIDN